MKEAKKSFTYEGNSFDYLEKENNSKPRLRSLEGKTVFEGHRVMKLSLFLRLQTVKHE